MNMKIRIKEVLEGREDAKTDHVTRAGKDVKERGIEIREDVLNSEKDEFIPYVTAGEVDGKRVYGFQKKNFKRDFTEEEIKVMTEILHKHGFKVVEVDRQESDGDRYRRAVIKFA